MIRGPTGVRAAEAKKGLGYGTLAGVRFGLAAFAVRLT